MIFYSVHSGSSTVHTPYHESNLVLRAMESKLHIVTANAADAKGPVNCATGVVSPEGEWVAQCPREGDQTFTYDIEVDTD